ncbi:lysozyme [Riemerella anatipestifer]|uniref:lysozyme n=1 Tax=Riemerella anatipestifer TaxID=34085 RepID=UPI0007ECB0DF|nr:lysozyme [Riemerella anatipestifer]OBP65000.1 hypothetical protein AWB84_00440 [Riemerella anatipestifer]
MKKEILEQATKIICEFEGFREYAYKDIAGIWTIGYGQTYYLDGRKVWQHNRIDEKEARLFVYRKVEKIYYNIVARINRTLEVHQYAAIISLVYNIGESAFNRSTLLKKINQNLKEDDIRKEWERWSYVKGKWVRGLHKRRLKELFIYYPKKTGVINFGN